MFPNTLEIWQYGKLVYSELTNWQTIPARGLYCLEKHLVSESQLVTSASYHSHLYGPKREQILTDLLDYCAAVA